MELQVKLLRALQEKEIERVGGRGTIHVDVRIIAATNRNLEAEVEAGRFRADLYYRLNIFPICLPSLRDRPADIPLLATHFIEKYAKRLGRKITRIAASVLDEIKQHDWPGNIRELEHIIERSLLLADGNILTHIYLPERKQKIAPRPIENDSVVKTMEESQRDHIISVLRLCKGRVAGYGGAAEFLGVPPSTLSSKLKRLGIQKAHYFASC